MVFGSGRRNSSVGRLVPAFVALVLAAAPALAQTPIDPLDARDARRLDKMEQVMRELRSIVFQGRDSGKPVVTQPAETDYQLQELTRRLADMEQTLSRLNGQIETSSHDLTQARRDLETQRAENKAIAARLQILEQQAQAAAAAAQVPVPAPLSSADAFAEARQAFQAGDYTGAETAFQDYVTRFGDGPKGPEARYWLGKTFAARAAYGDAATSLIGAIRGWPQTSWAPDAVLELSRALIRLRKPVDACQTLDEFTRRYPKAPAPMQARAAAARTQAKCQG